MEPSPYGDDLQQWVIGLYKDVLGRQASTAEQNGWVESLQAGVSRIDVARDFVHSHEADRAIVEDAYHPATMFAAKAVRVSFSSSRASTQRRKSEPGGP
jgi:hypothetical protein